MARSIASLGEAMRVRAIALRTADGLDHVDECAIPVDAAHPTDWP